MTFLPARLTVVLLVLLLSWRSLGAASATSPAAPRWLDDARGAVGAIAGARHAETYATAGEGTPSRPWTGWEAAFAGIPSTGGRIEFAAGCYTQSVPIKVPTGLTGWLAIVGGAGVTIKLTQVAPRFLDPDLTADHQIVRNIWIEGFAIDADQTGGKHHVIFGNYVAGGGVGGWRRVNWDRIVVKDVRAFNVPVDPTTSTHRGGIAILSSQASEAEPVANTITRIDLEDVRIEGGNWGILLDGGGAPGGTHANIEIDDVRLVRCWHSLLARQPYFASSNFQIGERARVGHVEVIDCFGQFAADTGLELNAAADAHVAGTTIEDAAVADFYYTDYNTPTSEPLVVFERCAAKVTGSVHAPYGVGWMFKDSRQSTTGGGRFRIIDSRYDRSGTPQSTATGAAVSAEGRLTELSITGSQLHLADVDLTGLKAGERVVDLDFENDVTFRLHDVTIEAHAVRGAAGGGLSAIATHGSIAGKTLTLDWDNVSVSTEIAGPPIDYTVFTTTIHATAASAVRGTIRNYRVVAVGGDDHARAINIDLARQVVAGSLAIDEVDARKLPAHGTAIQLNNVSDKAQARRVSMRRIRKPARP